MNDGWLTGAPIIPANYTQYKGPRPYPFGAMQCHQPPVIAAVAAAAVGVAGAGGVAAFSFLGVSGIGGVALFAGANLALGLLSTALQPSADSSSFASITSSGTTRQFSQAVTERRIVYGESRVSGPIVFVGSSSDNRYLHMCIALASHEVEEIGEIFVNEVSITEDMLTSDTVNDGVYDGLVRIKKHLGTTTQTADSDLVSSVDEWTNDHRLQGIAYIYVRLKYDRDAFPSGIPNISAWVKGKKVTDTRDATERWTPNVALITNDYLSDSRFGLGASDIDETALNAAANTCDEMVQTNLVRTNILGADDSLDVLELDGETLLYQTGDRITLSGSSLPGGLSVGVAYYVIPYQRKDTPRIRVATSLANAIAGVYITITSDGGGLILKTGEPRYFGGGVIKTSAERGNNLEEILSGMSGYSVYAGGVWRILAGEYQSPTISYSANDLVSPIKVQTKVSKAERFNRVQGVYVSPLNLGNPSDYPAVENSTYQTNDGEVIKKDINLAFTQRPHTAQRIAKIYLERARQEIVFSASFNLTAFKVQVGDNFYFSFPRYGWDEKIFEVIDWSLGFEDDEGVPRPVINISARENASAVYDWNSGEETTVDPAPNTTLPNPFLVSVVTGFSIDSIPISTQGGDKIFSILASWETPLDQFVSSGGQFEIEFKETTETEYKSAGTVDGSVRQMELSGLKPDVLYDVRIYQYNTLNVRSQPTTINNFQVGSTANTDTEDWENESLTSEDWENETLTAEDWEA